jgi:F-type H+-transporting ATPase subunit epsilon
MDLLKFELVSPERLLLSAEVQQVVVPGTEGLFAVLPGHAPVLSTLQPGVVEITLADGQVDRVFVRGGFAEVNPSGLTVLAEVAIPLSELNADVLAAEVRNAEEDVADASDDETRRRAQESLDHLRELTASLH